MTLCLCAVKCDMDGDFDQFEEIDDELLSSLPLSFPFESLPVEGGDGPDPKAEETKQEGMSYMGTTLLLML